MERQQNRRGSRARTQSSAPQDQNVGDRPQVGSASPSVTGPGSPLSLTIQKIVHGGKGLGRWEGWPVFVSGALPGEQVEAVVTAVRRDYVDAKSTRLVTAAPDRVDPPCPLFPRCGGCQLQHAAYRAQLAAKRAIVAESLGRLGGLVVDVPPVIASPETFGYRVRAVLKIGLVAGVRALGFYEPGSHAVVPVASCAVLHPRLQTALGPLTDLVSRSRFPLTGLREIEIQTTGAGAELVIVFRLATLDRAVLGAIGTQLRRVLPLRGLIAYDRRRHRWVGGSDALEERVDGFLCRVSDRTFLQINPGVNAALVAAAIEWADLTGDERVVDLYAGFGNFSLPFARRATQVLAVEDSASAVADARINARILGSHRLQVVHSSVESWRPHERDRRPDVAIVDPPRTGLSPTALDRLIALAPKQVLYVSCEPATLARDAKHLAQAGFRLARLCAFDMFPQTAHVEVLSLFRSEGLTQRGLQADGKPRRESLDDA